RSEDAAVREQRNRVLCIGTQCLVASEEEGLVFPERKAQRGAELLAVQGILYGRADGVETEIRKRRIKRQSRMVSEGIASIQSIVAEEAKDAAAHSVGPRLCHNINGGGTPRT